MAVSQLSLLLVLIAVIATTKEGYITRKQKHS
mgnify:CR=1 FL=1